MESAYRAPTAVCRAVVARVMGAGGRPVGFDLSSMALGFGGTLEAKRTAEALFGILGS